MIKGVIKKIVTEGKKSGYISMLLDTLGTSLLGNLLTSKAVIRTGQGTVRVGYHLIF